MNELIKINSTSIGNELVQAVSARELHTFLQVQTEFAEWIRSRIDDYDFVENQDFVCVSQKYGTANGGYATRKEYYITLDMAKELSMAERNEQGIEARRYFLLCCCKTTDLRRWI